ncbi:MAG: hypothetical protein R3B57_04090 [Phycisphaerales bacterium]
MTQTMRTLTAGLIDYAGLFPPAKLEMSPTVENYARYLRSEHAEMLGRLICPVSRLEELSQKGAMLMPGTYATSGYREMADDIPAWRISAIIDGELNACLDAIDLFCEKHSKEEAGLAVVDAIEMRVAAPQEIDDALDEIPEDISPAFEVPQEVVVMGDPRGFIAALAGNSSAAKIRCGGVKPEMIPPSLAIARFIHACARSDVPFKATAGLHHPVRAEFPLTYDAPEPRGVMHGFLNVFMGAALVRTRRIDEETTVRVLDETDAEAFTFGEDSCAWRDLSVDLIGLSRVREAFALSYGSCSFEEPVGDLERLGLV